MSFRWFIPPPSDGIPAGGFSPTFLIPCRGAECSDPVGQPAFVGARMSRPSSHAASGFWGGLT